MSETPDTSTLTSNASMPLLGGPEEVVRHPGMTLGEKREILARWASDAHAVENLPGLRQLDDGSVLGVDEILRALKALDAVEGCVPAERPVTGPQTRRRGRLLSRLRFGRRRRDHDDDPPPCPASAARPRCIVLADAVAA